MIFGITKFHQYLFGQKFILSTDNKALRYILDKTAAMPALAASRLVRWQLKLAAYDFDVEFKPTKTHANADMLSRLPIQDVSADEPINAIFETHINCLPITLRQLQEATKEDRVLNEVVKFLSTGIWPTAHDVNNELRPYYMKRGELSLHDNVIMWGLRVVLPLKFRARVLSDLHNGHPGIVRMKGLSRIHVWYQKIDQDIENTVHSCHECYKPKFISDEFDHFLKMNGIKHTRSSAYHPCSNGGDERFVQKVKRGLRACHIEKGDAAKKLDNFLFAFRTTPSTVTDRTPSELFVGRQIRTRLDILKPDMNSSINRLPIIERMKRYNEKVGHRVQGRQQVREFTPGQNVLIANHVHNRKWDLGTIVSKIAPRSYLVQIGRREAKRHVDDLISNYSARQHEENAGDDSWMYSDGPADQNVLIRPPLTSRHPRKSYPHRYRRPVDRYGMAPYV